MAKYSAEELSSRINELDLDDEVKISLMEDITDSITNEDSEEVASLKSELDKKQSELDEKTKNFDELKEKYKSRFLKADDEVVDEVKEDLEEKEVIDITEI